MSATVFLGIVVAGILILICIDSIFRQREKCARERAYSALSALGRTVSEAMIKILTLVPQNNFSQETTLFKELDAASRMYDKFVEVMHTGVTVKECLDIEDLCLAKIHRINRKRKLHDTEGELQEKDTIRYVSEGRGLYSVGLN